MQAHAFLTTLAIVLCTAGVTTVLFQRLRQPVVLGYLLAGLIVSPHLPIPIVADREVVESLSEVGVVLLLFALGLEFSLRKLAQVGATAGLTAVLQCSIMIWLGYVVARAFGWTAREAIFTGAIIAISSTTIIAKAFDERGIRGKLRELVVGILIVEDLIAILIMAALTAVAAGDGSLSTGTLARSAARLAFFLVTLVAIGMMVVPRMIRAIVHLQRDETTLVAAIGLCFLVALLAHAFGYSVALGAFIAGSLVAESGEAGRIERLIAPVRDMFAAIFFVSVGMLIHPMLIVQHWQAVLVLTLLVIVGKFFGVGLGGFLTGQGTRLSVQMGLSLAQIGEFSFIIAGLGIALGATRDFLYPVAVAVSAITTLTTPFLIASSGRVAAFVDRKLPRPLQTFVTLYGSWMERLSAAPQQDRAGAAARRMLRFLAVDTALLAGLIIVTFVIEESATLWLATWVGVGLRFAHGLYFALASLAAVPFWIGIVRGARRLGATLAEAALPQIRERKVDLADAPRRAFVVTLQLGIVLLVGLPLLAVTQPFVGGWAPAVALALVLVVLGISFWRNAVNLQGHMRAGIEMIAQVLGRDSRTASSPAEDALASVRPYIPGLGEPLSVRLGLHSAAVGKTLAELQLRGLTGATVLAIARGPEGVVVPTARETLRAGDVLVITGTHEACDAARALLETTN
jgi:CPA2 family monovalent cation:H+ antiporter-2